MKTHFEICNENELYFCRFRAKYKIWTFGKTYSMRKPFEDFEFDMHLYKDNVFSGIKSEVFGKDRIYVDFLNYALVKSPLITELVELTALSVLEIDWSAIALRYLEAQKLKYIYTPLDKNTTGVNISINFIDIPLPEVLKKYDCIVHAEIKENGITVEFRRYALLGLRISFSSDNFYNIRILDSSSKILSSEEVREIVEYFENNREYFLDFLCILVKESNINNLIERNVRYGDEE